MTNLIALTIGIASVLFVSNLLLFEMSFDQHMDDVFRVEVRKDEVPESLNAYSPSSLGPDLVDNASNLLTYARFIPFSEYRSAQLRYSSDTLDHHAYFKRAYYTDPSVIDLFRLELLLGHPKDFERPGAMIISQKAALDLFGEEWKSKVIGTELRHGRGSIQHAFQFVGVFADRDENTHLDFDGLISMATHGSGEGILSGYTYLSGLDITSVVSIDTLNFRPVSEIHTSQGVSNEAEPVANKSLLTLLAVVALIILLISITNYINSTIIHFIDRCKEVGIRKLHGATPGHLMIRLIGELLSINIIAVVAALCLFMYCAYAVNEYHLLTYPQLDYMQWPKLILLLTITIVANTLISAIYPFFFLNTIGIVPALKGVGSLLRTKALGQAGSVIRALLVFQIVASIVFLSASLIIYRQLQLLDAQPEEREIQITGVFPGLSGANERFSETAVGFLNEMSKFGSVVSYSFSNLYKGIIKSEHKLLLDDSISGYLTVVDPDYWKGKNNMISGRGFDYVFGQNPGQVVLDSTIAKDRFGYDKETGFWRVEGSRYESLGIIDPQDSKAHRAYVSGFRYLTYVDLVLNYQGRFGERPDQFLEKTEYMISIKFPYFFLLRREQEASGKAMEDVLALFIFFGGVCVLVAAIGLFGLSYFITQKKSREVGIRKIHGASTIHILFRLLTSFTSLVLLAGLLAAPLVYFGGSYWLDNYANRIELDASIFLLPTIGIALVTLFTVLNKSWKAATQNPIKILDEPG